MVLSLIKSLSLRGLFTALFLMVSLTTNAGTYYYNGTTFGSSFDDVANKMIAEKSNMAGICSDAPNSATSHKYYYYEPSAPADWCSNNPQFSFFSFIVWSATGTCPPDVPHEWSDGSCHAYEQCQNLDPVGISYNYPANTDGLNLGGCHYDFSTTSTCYYTPETDKTECVQNYLPTGDLSNLPLTVIGDEYIPAPQTNITEHTEPNTTTTDVTTPTTTNNPDGSTTTEQTTEITNAEGKSVSIVETSDAWVITDSSGKTTTIIKDESVTSNTDGSSVVTETETITNTTPNETTTSVDKGTGSVSQTGTSSTSSSSTSSKTTEYNASGDITSHTATGDDPQPLDEDGNAEYIQDNSEGSLGDDLSARQAEIAQLETELATTANNIRDGLSAALNVTFSEGIGSLPCFDPLDIGITTIQLCPANYNTALEVLPIIFTFLFAIIALFIVLRAGGK